MLLAVQKFKLQKITKKWNSPSDSEDKNVNCPIGNPTEMETESKKKLNTNKDKNNCFAEKPAWMFKELTETDNPRIWNNKEWWWCSTKTGGK